MQSDWIYLGITKETLPTCTHPASGVDRLAAMVKAGSLQTPIDSELPWTSISQAVDRLIQQQVDGKIVLHVGNS